MTQLLLLVGLLNAPFWVLSSHMFVSRAVISLDSLLIVILLEYSLGLGLFVLVASWLADITVSVATTYHFGTPSEFLRSAAYAGDIHWASFLTGAALISTLPFVLVLAALVVLPKTRIGIWPLLITVALLVLVDTTNGSSALSQKDVRTVPTNIAGSSMHSLARAVMEPAPDSQLSPVAGGMSEVSKYLAPAMASNSSVLYVIVESFGVHKNPLIRQWLQDQLFTSNLSANYTLTYQTAPSRGGTTLGEIRRLCGLYGSFRFVAKKVDLECIPSLFAKAGWSTVGMHGFSESMFSRRSWWPAMGLQDIRFAEELSSSGRRCGAAFRGVCDEDLIATAVLQAQRPRTFVYALTLNSHLPVAHIPISTELATLCADARVGDDVCTLLAHVSLVLQTLSRQLASQPGYPYVMLAGDHPPPFFSSDSRDQFEHETVPLFALLPKQPTSTAQTAASSPSQTGSGP